MDRYAPRIGRYEYLPRPLEQQVADIIHQEISFCSTLDNLRSDLNKRFDYSPIACFRAIDRYNSGVIDVYSLGQFLRNLGHYGTDRELLSIIRRIDENGDCKIRPDEFIAFMRPSPGFSPQPLASSYSSHAEERKRDGNSPLRQKSRGGAGGSPHRESGGSPFGRERSSPLRDSKAVSF